MHDFTSRLALVLMLTTLVAALLPCSLASATL